MDEERAATVAGVLRHDLLRGRGLDAWRGCHSLVLAACGGLLVLVAVCGGLVSLLAVCGGLLRLLADPHPAVSSSSRVAS